VKNNSNHFGFMESWHRLECAWNCWRVWGCGLWSTKIL